MIQKSHGLAVVGSVVLLLLVIFFWPGLHRYDTLRLDGNSYPVRTNRLTGHSEIFRGRWYPERGRSAQTPEKELAIALGDLEFRGELTNYGWFKGRVYNGSSARLRHLFIRGNAGRTADGIRWTRVLELNVNVPPRSSSDLLSEMKDQGLYDVTWTLERATGSVSNSDR